MKLDLTSPRIMRALLPPVSLALLLTAIFIIQPRAMSFMGLNLMLNLALPIALATIAQMFIIAINDIDLSIGSFVSFVACVGATLLNGRALPLWTDEEGDGRYEWRAPTQ